jgi:hypothetical protein
MRPRSLRENYDDTGEKNDAAVKTTASIMMSVF